MHKHLLEKKLKIQFQEYYRCFNNKRCLLPFENQIGKKQTVKMRTSTVTFDYKTRCILHLQKNRGGTLIEIPSMIIQAIK